MVEGGRRPTFPVVFFDGEREMDIGDVKINPTLEYKPFQLLISQKIGISPNQISIYLIDRKKTHKSEDRRRIPITGKVNFGLICRQRDCCFLVVLKRSRKSRNRRERTVHGGVEFADFFPDSEFSPPPPAAMVPENLILLRRNQITPPAVPFYDQITQTELADLNDRLQSLRIQRENYQMAMGMNSPNLIADRGLNPSVNTDSFRETMNKNEIKKALCEECVNAEKNGGTASFHPCVNDMVITRFATRLGPINRPNKPF